jgi:hypothetical protein
MKMPTTPVSSIPAAIRIALLIACAAFPPFGHWW